MFHVIEDSWVVTRSKGVYRQVMAYEKGGFIFCKHGAGFIRIMRSGTSAPNVSVDSMDLGFKPKYTKLGYMVKPEHPEAWKE